LRRCVQNAAVGKVFAAWSGSLAVTPRQLEGREVTPTPQPAFLASLAGGVLVMVKM
jgi:hypothetical protein